MIFLPNKVNNGCWILLLFLFSSTQAFIGILRRPQKLTDDRAIMSAVRKQVMENTQSRFYSSLPLAIIRMRKKEKAREEEDKLRLKWSIPKKPTSTSSQTNKYSNYAIQKMKDSVPKKPVKESKSFFEKLSEKLKINVKLPERNLFGIPNLFAAETEPTESEILSSNLANNVRYNSPWQNLKDSYPLESMNYGYVDQRPSLSELKAQQLSQFGYHNPYRHSDPWQSLRDSNYEEPSFYDFRDQRPVYSGASFIQRPSEFDYEHLYQNKNKFTGNYEPESLRTRDPLGQYNTRSQPYSSMLEEEITPKVKQVKHNNREETKSLKQLRSETSNKQQSNPIKEAITTKPSHRGETKLFQHIPQDIRSKPSNPTKAAKEPQISTISKQTKTKNALPEKVSSSSKEVDRRKGTLPKKQTHFSSDKDKSSSSEQPISLPLSGDIRRKQLPEGFSSFPEKSTDQKRKHSSSEKSSSFSLSDDKRRTRYPSPERSSSFPSGETNTGFVPSRLSDMLGLSQPEISERKKILPKTERPYDRMAEKPKYRPQ